jgi:hypothetical protein
VILRFVTPAPGNPVAMPRDDARSDEVPVADAVEQHQDTTGPVPDEEVSVEAPSDVPLETTDQDWQEQQADVADAEEDEYDRD